VEKEIRDRLLKIKGIGKKSVSEILEEYDSVENIISDIESDKFIVGGIDKKKISQILKTLKN